MATSDSNESKRAAATSARVAASTLRSALLIFRARPLFRAPSADAPPSAPPALAPALAFDALATPNRDDASSGVTSCTKSMTAETTLSPRRSARARRRSTFDTPDGV
jgi:hypothetical protein